MATALTLYPLESQATGTLSTASNMASGTGGTAVTSVTTKAPPAHTLGYGQIYPLGNSGLWAASGSIGTPDGNGWLWDVTTLQNQTVAAGNWTPTITIAAFVNSCVADLHFRLYTYNAGVYTFQNEFILTGVTISTAQTAHTFPAASLAALSYGTGDKVYCDVWMNITTNNSGCLTFALKCSNSVPGTGGTTDNQLVTPGYSTSSTTSTKNFTMRGNVAGLSDYLWPIRGNIGHQSTKNFTMRGLVTTPAKRVFAMRGNVGIQKRVFVIRGNIGTTFHSPLDLHIYKQQMVMVYTPAGVFLDCWPDAPLLAGFKESINAATSPMKVVLPRGFENYDPNGRPQTIAQGNVVKYYLFGPGLPSTGLLRYQGYIDGYEAQISDSDGGETLTVSLVPFSSAVMDHGIVGTHSFGTAGSPSTYVDPVVMFDYFFTATDSISGKKYANPLTLDPTNPVLTFGPKAQFTFQDQTVGSCWESILLLAPVNWFFRTNVDSTVTFNVPPTTAQHTFVIGADIVAPQYSQDWQLLKNVARVKGAPTTAVSTTVHTDGTFNASTSTTINNKFTSSETATSNPTVSMNAAPTTASSVTITTITATKTSSDVNIYGERIVYYADNRIVDSNTAQQIAQGHINVFDQTVLRAKIRLLDYRGDLSSGLGFDIETIKVGDTCMLIDPSPNDKKFTLWGAMVWDVSDWDYSLASAINTVCVINALTYGFDYVDLELGSLQPSLNTRVHVVRRRFEEFKMI